jgi:hypothetical protein
MLEEYRKIYSTQNTEKNSDREYYNKEVNKFRKAYNRWKLGQQYREELKITTAIPRGTENEGSNTERNWKLGQQYREELKIRTAVQRGTEN